MTTGKPRRAERIEGVSDGARTLLAIVEGPEAFGVPYVTKGKTRWVPFEALVIHQGQGERRRIRRNLAELVDAELAQEKEGAWARK